MEHCFFFFWNTNLYKSPIQSLIFNILVLIVEVYIVVCKKILVTKIYYRYDKQLNCVQIHNNFIHTTG